MAGSLLLRADRHARSLILRVLNHPRNKNGALRRGGGPAATDAARILQCATSSDVSAMTNVATYAPNTVGDIVLWRDTNTANTWHVLIATAVTDTDDYTYSDISGAFTLCI